MRTETKNPPAVGADAAGLVVQAEQLTAASFTHTHNTKLRSGTKLRKVLAALASGRGLNRFEAYRELHDSVLNSTVAKIERPGVVVARRPEIVPGHAGSRVACSRYWLTDENCKMATRLLGLGHGA